MMRESLNIMHSGFLQCRKKQLDWLCGSALKFDEPGWSVMFAHSLLFAGGGENPPEIAKNMELLRQIVLAYKKGENYSKNFGEGDFERKIDAPFESYTRGDIIGFLVGDYHYDDVVYYEDIPLILTGNAVMYDKGAKTVCAVTEMKPSFCLMS